MEIELPVRDRRNLFFSSSSSVLLLGGVVGVRGLYTPFPKRACLFHVMSSLLERGAGFGPSFACDDSVALDVPLGILSSMSFLSLDVDEVIVAEG